MKIGYLIEYFYPHHGGAENNCYYLAKELAKKHEVHIFTSQLNNTKRYEVINNIHIHRYRTLLRYKYYLSITPGLIEILNYKLDILHTHSFGFLYHDFLILLKKLSNSTRLINTPHGPFMALNSYNFPKRIFKKIVENLEKPINNLYDRIIQVNPYQYKWMKRIRIKKDKVIFIPNGIDEEIFKKTKIKLNFEAKLKDKKIISYVGRSDRYKGLDQIIRILPFFKDIVLVIVGEDVGDKKRLELISRKLKIESRVIFTGRLSEEKKLRVLAISTIFILPSEWEAFGISMLEAMSQGNIIISTKTEGGKFLIKENENGFLYDFNNIEQLKEKINLILKNKKLQEKIKINNIKKAKQFLWKNIAKDLEKVYLNIISQR